MVDHGTGRLLALCLSVAGVLAMPADVDAAARTTVVTSNTYVSGDPGGGHLVECKCRATSKHAEPGQALAEWRRINRPARSARKVMPATSASAADNIVQLDSGNVLAAPVGRKAAGGSHGRR